MVGYSNPENDMFPPLTIKLPSGLELTLWPRQPRRKWGGFGPIIDKGETEQECWIRMAKILKTTDFDSVTKTFAMARHVDPDVDATPRQPKIKSIAEIRKPVIEAPTPVRPAVQKTPA